MKKFLYVFIFLIILCNPLYSEDKVSIYYQGNLYGEMTFEEFEYLVAGAEFTSDMIYAESKQNIKILINNKDNTSLEIKVGETNFITLNIQWFKIDKKTNKEIILKEMVIERSILIKKDPYNRLYMFYRDVAGIGFPVLLLLIIGAILI